MYNKLFQIFARWFNMSKTFFIPDVNQKLGHSCLMTTVGVLEKRRQERKFIWLLINLERFNLRRPHKQVTRQAGGPPPRIEPSSSLGGRWRKGGSGVEKKLQAGSNWM